MVKDNADSVSLGHANFEFCNRRYLRIKKFATRGQVKYFEQKSRDTAELWYLNLGSLLYCMPLANAGDKQQVSRFVLFFYLKENIHNRETFCYHKGTECLPF